MSRTRAPNARTPSVPSPIQAMLMFEPSSADRRTRRRLWRRVRVAAVSLTVAASMFCQQTGIYAGVERSINEAKGTDLRPGPVAMALDSIRRAMTALARAIGGLSPQTPGSVEVFRPGGMPYPWQAADGSVPFSQINLSNGNVISTIPIVNWGGLGGGLSFVMFRNNLDPPYVATLPTGWSHSYSRHIYAGTACGCGGSQSAMSAGGAAGPVSAATLRAQTAAAAGSGLESSQSAAGVAPGAGAAGALTAGSGGATQQSVTTNCDGVWLQTDDGRWLFFYQNGTGYGSPVGIRLTLANRSGGGWVLSDAHQNKSYFTSDGFLDKVEDASSNAIVVHYDTTPTKRVKDITDVIGNKLELFYDTSGRLSSIKAPPIDANDDPSPTGRVFEIGYNGTSGVLEKIHKAIRRSDGTPKYHLTLGYNGSGSLASIQDYRIVGDFSTNPPTPPDAEISDQTPPITTLTYTSTTITVTHPKVADYVVGGSPINRTRLITFYWLGSDPDLNPCYSPNSGLTDVRDERSTPGTTRYTFDTSGRLQTVRDPLNRYVAALAWNSSNRLTSVTGALPNSMTSFSYDTPGNLTSVTDANTHTTAITYDGLNNLRSVTDPLSQIVYYDYNTNGPNPTRVTRVDGTGNSDILLDYGTNGTTDKGELTQLTSANSVIQKFGYDKGFLFKSAFGQLGSGSICAMWDSAFDVRQNSGRNVTGFMLGSGDYWTTSAGCQVVPSTDGDPTFNVECSYDSANANMACLAGSCVSRADEEGQYLETCINNGCGGWSAANSYNHDGNGNVSAVENAQNDGTTGTENQFIHTVLAYDSRNRLLTETASAGSQSSGSGLDMWMHPGRNQFDPEHQIRHEYSDTTGRMRVTWHRVPRESGFSQRADIVTEYFTDAAGRVTEIKRDGVSVATYSYADSTTSAAITETKPVSNVATQYYLDKAGRVMKVLHCRGTEQLAGFVYTRDNKDRISEVKEYGGTCGTTSTLRATTNFAYGDGHLTTSDLDATASVDRSKLYWHWLAGFSNAFGAGDPNRLVAEQRTGDSLAYKKEYWYDPGGNRLAMRESVPNGSGGWNVAQITRYNYMAKVSYDQTLSAIDAESTRSKIDLDPQTAGVQTWSGEPQVDGQGMVIPEKFGTSYSGLGRDALLSSNTYKPGDDQFRRFSVYWYARRGARISHKIELWNEGSGSAENRVWRKHVQRFWHADGFPPPGPFPVDEMTRAGPHGLLRAVTDEQYSSNVGSCSLCTYTFTVCPDYAFEEVYGYDWQGRRIAKLHCADACLKQARDPTTPNKNCGKVVSYDYDGGAVLVERSANSGERLEASYVHGPLGVIERVNETRDATASNNCPYDYLGDATGHCAGVVGASAGSPAVDWTRMDAWGVLLTPLAVTSACASQPAVAMGEYQYHGKDGYQTDLVEAERDQSSPSLGRSTGYVHVGVRYYDPAIGRFLQYDPKAIDLIPCLLFGQCNRWAFASNNPVAFHDPTGMETVAEVSFSAFIISICFTGIIYSALQAAKGVAQVVLCMASSIDAEKARKLHEKITELEAKITRLEIELALAIADGAAARAGELQAYIDVLYLLISELKQEIEDLFYISKD